METKVIRTCIPARLDRLPWIVAAATEFTIGVAAEGQSLEEISRALSART